MPTPALFPANFHRYEHPHALTASNTMNVRGDVLTARHLRMVWQRRLVVSNPDRAVCITRATSLGTDIVNLAFTYYAQMYLLRIYQARPAPHAYPPTCLSKTLQFTQNPCLLFYFRHTVDSYMGIAMDDMLVHQPIAILCASCR